MRGRGAALAILVLCSTAVAAGQRQVFRTGTAAMLVDVFVTERGAPVQGLTPASFELRDNDVLQTVTSVNYERAPLSITLVLEAGASPFMLTRLDRAVAHVAEGLQADDRCALITFGRRITQVSGSLTGPVLIQRPPDEGPAGGDDLSANDAVIAALAAGPSAGRRQVIVLFTSKPDTASFMGWNDVLESAWRSPAMVQHIRASPVDIPRSDGRGPAMPAGLRGGGSAPLAPGNDMVGTDTLSLATGGSVRTATPRDDLGTVFQKAIDDARMSYVLSYTPANVKPGGWHQVLVRVRKGEKFFVRARQGYFGG
jgi:hypothetical protein